MASVVFTGCTRAGSAEPSVAPPTTIASTTSSSTSTSTTSTSTTTTTIPPSEFATTLAAGDRRATPLWTFDQPAAAQATVGDGWVAVAAYSDGRRWDSVLDLASGEKKWSRVSTDSVASGPDHDIAPLVLDGGYVHLERFGISDGATLELVDVDTGVVRWAEDQPRWFEAPPYACGEQRICAVTWDTYEGARRLIQLDTADGRLVAQGPISGTEILNDVRLVSGPDQDDRPPYPQPPATIPGDVTAPPPDATPAPTAPATPPPATTPQPTTQPATTQPGGDESTTTSLAAGSADGFRSPRTAEPEPQQPAMVTRFAPTGQRLWQFPLSDLVSSSDATYATPVGVLDAESNTFVIATPSGALQPGDDIVVGIDYDTGERLWTAQNRSFDCWEWMVRPDNVRCHVQGILRTSVDEDGVVTLVSNSDMKVTFEAFDPRSGKTLGEVTSTYPAWDGEGKRPIVPSKTWIVDGGLAIDSTSGLVALSTTDGEVIEVEAGLTGWCQNLPVDDDGEIFPGYFPCAVGDATRSRQPDIVPPIPDFVGSVSNGTAVYVADGSVSAYRLVG